MISFHKGFLKISNEYSSTKAGNIANYYAAICQMNLGFLLDSLQYFENALSSLSNFEIIWRAGYYYVDYLSARN